MSERRITAGWALGIATLALLSSGTLWYAQAQGAPGTGAPPEVTVYKSATCGCCHDWATYLAEHGFRVREVDVPDAAAIMTKHGVPDRLASCHTATVDGYVVEGHVPAEAIHRLLTERPAVRGIAVPGMPMGSPGMEHGDHKEAYTVFTFDRSGRTSVFERR